MICGKVAPSKAPIRISFVFTFNHHCFATDSTEKENTDFTEERISALEAIGMVWDVHKFKWNRMYEIAKRYYLYFGHLNVKHTEEFENVKLGSWIVNQRSAYRKQSGRKPLSEEQIEALNKIGMKW